jgi:gamma-butyrobetaine dioxygenase
MADCDALNQTVELGEHGLNLVLADGTAGYFNYYWLRDNCPSSFDRETRERTFDIFHLTSPPKPMHAVSANNVLTIRWHGDGHESRYALDQLAAYARGERRHDPADMPRRAWYAGHYRAIARFAFAELQTDRDARAAWLRAVIIDGIAIVTAMPNSDAGLTALVGCMGHVRPTFFGDYFDVRTHIAPTNLAYTAKALELHTDTPAEEHAPGIQFLHCRANSVDGGENMVLDGVAVANDLKVAHPEDFDLLAQTDIPFYCEHDDYDARARQRVIELDEHGDVSGVTISQHMADMFDLPQRALDAYYPAFCRFGRMMQSEKYLMRFRIEAGQCLVFDNHRVVHGRAAYTATSGDRYLRGCYADRSEMRSSYRALVGAGRFT